MRIGLKFTMQASFRQSNDLRCCLESVCDAEYAAATRCLLGLLSNASG